MIRRNTWIVLVFFVILLAGTLFWQRTKQQSEPTVTPTVALGNERLFNLGSVSVSGITIQDEQGNKAIYERSETGTWSMTYPTPQEIESFKLQTALTDLLSARILTPLDPGASLSNYGLQPAKYRLLMQLDNGKQITVDIGNPTSIESGYYVVTSDSETAYVVSKTNLDSALDLLASPPYLPTPTPEASETPTAPEVTPLPGETLAPTVTP